MYFFFRTRVFLSLGLRDRKIWAYFSPFGIIHAVLSRIYSLFGGGVPKFTNINYAYKEWQVRPAFSLFKLLYDQAVHEGRPTTKKFFLGRRRKSKNGRLRDQGLKAFFSIVLRIRFLALKGENSLSDPKCRGWLTFPNPLAFSSTVRSKWVGETLDSTVLSGVTNLGLFP